MPGKAIILGINGQDGAYLANLLKAQQIDVVGVSRSPGPWIQGTVTDRSFIEGLVKTTQPQFIFHLAADSTTSHHALFTNHESICTGTLNVLEAARAFCRTARIFLSGSAVQFENHGSPINETTPFSAGSPYAVARIQSVYAGRYFRKKFSMPIYIGYLFNHDSPLRTESHVNQKIIMAAKRIAAGCGEKFEIGDISVRKEFNFAGDIVAAIWMLVNQHDIYEAVIGSGEAHSIEEWLTYSFQSIGRDWRDHAVLVSEYIPEYSCLVSDPTLLMSRVRWKPKVSFNTLADMMLRGGKNDCGL